MPRKIELSAAYARLALQSGVAPTAELLRGVVITEEALAGMEFIDASDLAVMFRNYDHCVSDCAWTARLGAPAASNDVIRWRSAATSMPGCGNVS